MTYISHNSLIVKPLKKAEDVEVNIIFYTIFLTYRVFSGTAIISNLLLICTAMLSLTSA